MPTAIPRRQTEGKTAAPARERIARPVSAGRRDPLAPRRVAQAMTAMLAAAAAVALLAVGLTLNPAGSAGGASTAAAHAEAVRGFYMAVNDILAGGDPDALDSFVAPDVVVHAAAGQIGGRAELAADITRLGIAAPGLRLRLADLVIEGDRAAATVERAAPAPPGLDIVDGGEAASPAATERFRFASGRIAEYWRPWDGRDVTWTLPPVSLPLWLGPKQAGLARFTFPPGTVLDDLVASGPHLILPETGTLTVSLDGQAELARLGDNAWRPTSADRLLTIGAGDALLVPGGIRHTIRNRSTAGASMLGVLIFSTFDTSGESRRSPKPEPSALSSMYGALPFRTPEEWNGRASSELLARGNDSCVARRTANLVITWLSLEPGQTVAPHPVHGVEVAAVEAGAPLVGRLYAALVANPGGDHGVGLDAASDPRLATAGDGIAFSTGLSSAIGNGESEAARLVLVRLGPASASGDLAPAARRLASQTAPDACRSDPPEVGDQ